MAGLLRVTGGALARRRFKVPQRGVRPTADRVREALFSALGPAVQGAVVVDAYAGSGALGIEALSRGAERCTFLERDKRTAGLLRENLQALGLTERSEVMLGDAGKRAAELERGSVDLLLCDPPYDDAIPDETWAAFARALALEGELVVERRAKRDEPTPAGFELTFDRTWGEARVRILRPAVSEEGEGETAEGS